MFEELKGKRVKWVEAMLMSIFAVSLAGLGVEFGDGRLCLLGLFLLIPALLLMLLRMPKSPKLLAILVVAWVLCAYISEVMFALSVTLGIAYIVFVLFKGVMG